MTDWKTILRTPMRGIAVEGDDDKRIIEAFLDAGKRSGLWGDWTLSWRIEGAGSFDKVLKEIADPDNVGKVWGIVDRDWRSESEIKDLQTAYPYLLILPRTMIDNYCVHPDELLNLLPSPPKAGLDIRRFQAQIETRLTEWVHHGALSAVLYENGAYQFCRGAAGYPRRLLDKPVTDEREIAVILEGWRKKLDPKIIVAGYKKRVSDFLGRSRSEQYWFCVDGKGFFNQVLIPILNKQFGQQDRDTWLSLLFRGPDSVPADLEPILRQLVP